MKIIELNTKEYEELIKKGLVEEEKKIPETFDPCIGGIMSFESVENIFSIFRDEINEIIDYLDYLKSKGDE